MAQKSKTQKAKASAARAARKEAREEALLKAESETTGAETSKKTTAASKEEAKKPVKKAEKKPKKPNRLVQFFKDVKSEMKRVTWPTKKEIGQWSVVVVAALVFFGVFVAVLDNVIVTPLLIAISSLAG